jgi:glycerol kinase
MGVGRAYLAIDQGSHASRAIVYAQSGQTLSTATIPIETRREGEDRVEHDAATLAESVRIAARQACAALDTTCTEVVSVGLATQRSTIVCWDRRNGDPLSPAISWADRRESTWLHSLAERAPRLRELTGLPLSPHYGASKLRWCLKNLPAVSTAAQAGRLRMGPLSAFLAAALTGDFDGAADPANASRTLLYGLDIGDWHAELLEMFDIDRAWLPRCVPTRHDFGAVPEAGGAPLAICSGDQSCIPFAFGATQPGDVYVNIGTGAFLLAPLTLRPNHPTPLLQSLLYSDAASCRYALEGTVNGAGAALAWLDREYRCDSQALVVQLNEISADELRPPLFLNAIGGLGSPYWQPNLSSHFVAADATTAAFDPQILTAAVLESIAFLVGRNLEEIGRTGFVVRRIWLTGGLAQSRYLAQAIADLAKVLTSRSEFTEATGLGVARLLGAGRSESELQPNAVFQPRPAPHRQARYLEWQQMIAAAIAHLARP